MNQTLVLFHGGCRDGFCAAWVVNKHLQLERNQWVQDSARDNKLAYYHEPQFIPAYYGQEPPDCKGKDVIIVDFCYDLERMKKILNDCKSLIWLDHHKTASAFADWLVEAQQAVIDKAPEYSSKLKFDFLFIQIKSGAGLAWDYFFPNEPRPWLVDYVEDRDLWNKKLPSTDLINAYIACLEFDFKVWDEASGIPINMVEQYGYIAEMKTEQYVKEVCKNVYYVDFINNNSDRTDYGCFISTRHPKEIHTWFKSIPVVNICQVDCSEVLHELCKRNTEREFSLYWFKRADGLYQYGMRSIGDFDCSVVAKLFGGGGHRNAAGFQLSYLLEELK